MSAPSDLAALWGCQEQVVPCTWLLALASSSPSQCRHRCLMDIYSHLSFLGSVFLFGTWDEQGPHPGCAEQGRTRQRFVPVVVMGIFWQMSRCSHLKGKG